MMTKEIEEALLSAKDDNEKVLVHYFSLTGWDWYIVKAEKWGDDLYLYGFVCGQFNEWGPVMLSELKELNDKHLVERDLYMKENLTAYEYAKYNGHNPEAASDMM